LSLPINVTAARSKKKRRKHLRKRWQLLLVWSLTLGICFAAWSVLYNYLADDSFHASVNTILGGLLFTLVAIIAAVVLSIGILDSRGHL